MDRDSRVAFFLPDLLGGGGQRVVLNLVNFLGQRGRDVDLVLAFGRGEFVEQVDDSVTLVDLETPKIPGVGAAACLPRFVRYLRARDPDVLLSALMYANTVALAAHEIAGTDGAVIPTEHTTFGMQTGLKDRFVISLAKRFYPRANQVVAVSEGVKRSVLAATELQDSDVTVVYNPVVTPEIHRCANERVDHEWFRDDLAVILGVGRLESEKNFSDLVRAFARIARERDDVRLMILGNGSKKDALRELSVEFGVGDKVSLPGHVDNPYKYMRNASVFALSSVREGLPTVLIEAMACGSSVVATDCPHGPAEILDEGKYGLLVPMNDDEALANAVSYALDNPVAADLLRDRAADFSIEAIAADYERLVERFG